MHLLAQSDMAGTLSSYYAYPYLIASFWPLLGVLLDRRRGDATGDATGRDTGPLLAFCAMIAVSFAGLARQHNPGQFELPRDFLSPPSLARQADTDRAVAVLARSRPLLGSVLVDGSVVALAPDDFTSRETVMGRGTDRPDTVVYFVRGYESHTARGIAAAAGLNRHYRVPGTSLRIATDHPIVAPVPIAALLVPAAGGD